MIHKLSFGIEVSTTAENSDTPAIQSEEPSKKTNQNDAESMDTVDHVAENGDDNVVPIIQNGDVDNKESTPVCVKSVDFDLAKSNGEACEENSDVISEPSNSKNDSTKSEVSSVNEEDKTSIPASKCDESSDKTNEIFTDAMIDRIEQNYNPNDDDNVNLLETPDEEIFELEEKQTDKINLAESNKVSENSDASEAVNLLIQGKRNMLLKDYESAVSTLGEACRKFASIYSDLGVECAEVYMTYGQALLELWRVEDANKKKNEDVDESKVTENNDDLIEDEAEVQENSITEPDAEESLPEKDQNEKEDMEITNESNEIVENCAGKNGEITENDDKAADLVSISTDEVNKEDENQGENNDDEEVESEEEVDNLEVAWEILELAKTIYEKTNDDANLAKVHSKLGEISIASGNFLYAIDDLKRSLEFIGKIPSVDVRHKANIHFQLYIAHSMKCNFPEAEAELRIAKSTFESHLYDLEKKLKLVVKEKTSEIDAISSEIDAISSEIDEIKEVIRDMNSKMVDCHKEKRELISAISEVIKNKSQLNDIPSSSADVPSSSVTSDKSSSNFSPLKSDVPVNNISHLIRKKPKEPKNEEKNAEKSSNEISCDTETVLNCENSSESNNVLNKTEDAPESSTKRKAIDDLENEAKKFCA